MSQRRDDHDPELRELLDSIGLTAEYSVPTTLTDEEIARAEQMLAQVMSVPRTGAGGASATLARRERTSWLRRQSRSRLASVAVAAAVCVLAGVLVVVQPWGAQHSAAQTPAMLHFANVRAGQIAPSGEPAGELLHDLAVRATAMPEPAELPVQRVELDAWWSSSEWLDDQTQAQSVLVPVRSVAYLLPTGERRAIEYRGEPLDADGRPTSLEVEWDGAPSMSDSITPLNTAMGVDYPESLPATQADLIEALAPADACTQTRGGCLLSEVATMFEGYVVSPRVTARIWEALATEPSITTLGPTVDRLGRNAVALTAAGLNPLEQVVILVDPESGSYLGSEVILVEVDPTHGFDPPAVLSFTAVVSAERVAESDVPDDSTAVRY